MQQQRPLSPHLQIYKPMYTMVLSITHRITGVLLSLGFLLFVYWLWSLAAGPEAYACALECLSSVWVKLLLLGLMFSFFYHLCNGIRHLFWDAGYGLEKKQARASGWAVVFVSIALTAITAVCAVKLCGGSIGGGV